MPVSSEDSFTPEKIFFHPQWDQKKRTLQLSLQGTLRFSNGFCLPDEAGTEVEASAGGGNFLT
jgi:hypothetical protein